MTDEETPSAWRLARSRFAAAYGAGPGHLLVVAASFALAGYVVSILLHVGHRLEIAYWVAGAIVAHDLVLFPLYAAGDALLGRLARRSGPAPAVPWRNHVRVPLVVSGVLLLMTFPLVFGLSQKSYERATGLSTSVYPERYGLVAAVLFGASALIWAVRVLLARRGRPVTDAPDGEVA